MEIPQDESGKLFVGGLAHETDEKKLQEYFSKFGEVESVNIKYDQISKKSRGFGFVKFASAASAREALRNEDHFLDGKRIDPKPAAPIGTDPSIRSKKIFVGGLQAETTEDRLKEYFSRYGEIVGDVQFTVDRNTNKRKGFCFVEFNSEEVVDSIVKKKFHEIGGRQVETKRAYSKQQQQMLSQKGLWPLPGAADSGRGMPSAVRGTHFNPYGMAAASAYPTNVYGASTPVIYVDPTTGMAYPAVYTSPSTAASAGSVYGSAGMEVLYQPYTAARDVRYATTPGYSWRTPSSSPLLRKASTY